MLPMFEQMLKEVIGLDAPTIGAAAVERAVLARAAACKCADLADYWARLTSCEAERQELIEAVVVPETWFFRDREAFDALVRMASERWLAPVGGPLRIASLPCATGEEPYSIVMSLLDAGFQPGRLEIRAFDISERALARARRGVYNKNSFRSRDLTFRDRWFSHGPEGYRVADAVRACVSFEQANLFEPGFPLGPASCDVIFCRNLLIYFDGPTQVRAVKLLSNLLVEEGVLFVGPSEASLLVGQGFESARVPLAFAFRKQSSAVQAKAVQAKPSPSAAKRAARPQRPIHKPQPVVQVVAPASSTRAKSPPKLRGAAPPEGNAPSIDDIRRLADLGRLEEADRSCEAHLRHNGASAELFYLLGLIRDAGGDRAQAAASYRKALYLDPHHREALAHLAALLDSEGDGRGAKVLGERLRRLSGTA